MVYVYLWLTCVLVRVLGRGRQTQHAGVLRRPTRAGAPDLARNPSRAHPSGKYDPARYEPTELFGSHCWYRGGGARWPRFCKHAPPSSLLVTSIEAHGCAMRSFPHTQPARVTAHSVPTDQFPLSASFTCSQLTRVLHPGRVGKTIDANYRPIQLPTCMDGHPFVIGDRETEKGLPPEVETQLGRALLEVPPSVLR